MKYIAIIVLMISLTRLCSQDAPSPDKVSYRPPTVAGSFYPDNPDTLRNWVNDYLAKGEKADESLDIIGIVSPHAGYVYSGWIAGMAFKSVEGRRYDAVIVIAPSHTKAFKGASIFDGDAYVTPLGELNVDYELSEAICEVTENIRFSRDGHSWKSERSEHSLEVQLPFIQIVLPDTKIVAVVMGSQDFETADALMRAIVTGVKKLKRKVLIVASSDLSHYHDAETARTMDLEIVNAFKSYDYFKLSLNVLTRRWEACGGGPIVVAMMAAEQLGANRALPIQYANSSESPYMKTDKKNVVGYMSGIIYKDNEKSVLLPEISDSNKQKLLEIAKTTVTRVSNGEDYAVDMRKIPQELSDEYAVFVTLEKKGKLRGCMGHTIADNPLIKAVEESARLACSRDPRFPIVQPIELNDIDIEITILSRMKRVMNVDEIEPGRDGVLIRLGYNSGLFLPQVASEQGWDRTKLLEQLGLKAGLNSIAYKDSNAELYIFKGMIIH